MNLAQLLLATQPAALAALVRARLIDVETLYEIISDQDQPTVVLMQHDHYERHRGAIVQRGWAM